MAFTFDLDGTLVDSEPWHKRSEVQVLHEFGINISEGDLSPYMGTTLKRMLAGLRQKFSTVPDVDGFLKIQWPILSAYVREKLELFPDVPGCLSKISQPKALATSSMRWYVDEVLGKFPLLRNEFSVVICESDITHAKPHPEMFLLAASRIDVEPQDCVVVEDSPNGVAAGRAAGCFVVGIQRNPVVDLSEANLVVDSLAALNPSDFLIQ